MNYLCLKAFLILCSSPQFNQVYNQSLESLYIHWRFRYLPYYVHICKYLRNLN